MKPLLLTVLIFISCKSVKPPADFNIPQLRQQILAAENLVIFDQIKNKFYQSDIKEVSKLASLIEINKMDDGHDCLCYADYVLIFYKNEQYDFALGLHPGMGLRWTNGPWLADGLLDEFSYFLVLDWIKTKIKTAEELNGYELPEVLIETQ